MGLPADRSAPARHRAATSATARSCFFEPGSEEGLADGDAPTSGRIRRGARRAERAAARLRVIALVDASGATTSRSSTGSWTSRAHEAAHESGGVPPDRCVPRPSLTPAPGRTATMELTQIIKTLWIARSSLAAGRGRRAARRVLDLVLDHERPRLERSYVYGAAQTQILIDCPRCSLLDLNQETAPLATRAAVYAAFMRSNADHRRDRQETGASPATGHAQGPFTTAGGTQNIPRPARRAPTRCAARADTYRLVFDDQQDLPIVSVYAQAPTAEAAIRLANAAPSRACRTTSATWRT